MLAVGGGLRVVSDYLPTRESGEKVAAKMWRAERAAGLKCTIVIPT